MNSHMDRQPEPEYMDLPDEAMAYAGADFADVNQAFVERLVELAGDAERALALDLGTGPGDIPLRLLRLRPDWRIVALDASLPMLQHTRANAQRERQTQCVYPLLADAKWCPFPAAAFDIVFSNSILHHVTDVASFWSEVGRVARPGALIFLRDLARPASLEAARAIVHQHSANESSLLQEEFYRSLLAAYTVPEVRAQLDQAGLTTLSVEMVSDRHLDIAGHLA